MLVKTNLIKTILTHSEEWGAGKWETVGVGVGGSEFHTSLPITPCY